MCVTLSAVQRALQQPPKLHTEPMSRLRLSKDVAKATRRQRSRRSPATATAPAQGRSHWAGSAACAGRASVAFGAAIERSRAAYSKWPSNLA